MKKTLVVVLVIAMAIATVFAQGAQEAKTESKGKVVMTISNQQNEFIVGMGNRFKEVGAEYGYEVQLLDAQVDPTKQLAQIESAITQGAVAIFLEPCSYDGLTSGLKLAYEAGIPVFTIHNGVSATEYVTSAMYVDVRDGGRIKMQKVVEDIGGKGDIAIMTGTTGQDTTNQICGGYYEVLANYPDVNIVFTGAANWSAADAAPLAENWIASGKKLDAIVCNNDGMALGVLPVLKTTGNVGKIKLYGLDATSEGLKAVKAGEMTGTIYVDAHGEIVQAFKALEDLRAGKEIQKEYIIPAKLVDSSNIDEYLK